MKWCVWVADSVLDYCMCPEEVEAETAEQAKTKYESKLTGEYIVEVEPMENLDKDQSLFTP